MRIAEIASDQSRGRINNIMHVGAATTARAAKLAEHAARTGVEAICCVPPFFYRQSDEAIVEHYALAGPARNLGGKEMTEFKGIYPAIITPMNSVISWPVTIGILRPVRAFGVSQEMNTGPYRYSSMSVAQIPQ